jgi:hypothetical protein
VYHAYVDRSAQLDLRPRALVERLRALPPGEVAAAFELPFLLVRADDAAGELAESLEALVETGVARVAPGMGFHTASTERRPARARSVPPPPMLATEALLVRVVRATHVVVPLGKRPDAGSAFSERIGVGRARNSDVVLRHASVSKFHAWFARDEQNTYFITDASSRNGTWRNGTPLTGGQGVRLANGDLLRFGDVEATFCDAATLWEALHG